MASLSTPLRRWRYLRKGTFRRQKRLRSRHVPTSPETLRSDGCGRLYRYVVLNARWGLYGTGAWIALHVACQGSQIHASGCPHCHRIPRTENQLPRPRNGRRHVPRSMPELRQQRTQWAYEHILKLSMGCRRGLIVLRGGMSPSDRPALRPYQRAHVSASVDRGRRAGVAVGIRSKKKVRFHWEQVWDLTRLSGGLHQPLGRTIVKTGLLVSGIVNQLGRSLREIRDTWSVPREEDMAGIVPESRLGWGLGTEKDAAPRPPEIDMLAAHNPGTTNSSRELRVKLILLNVTHAHPQARVHLRGGSTDRDGSAATTYLRGAQARTLRSPRTIVLRRASPQIFHRHGGKL